jgi:L-alanine-DL-glutamate epimerase-like enolase superfamily enzyme
MTAVKSSDIQIRRIGLSHERYSYRAPMKFGGRTVTECLVLNVECEVATRQGRSAVGFGSMPLSNVWAYPSSLLSYEQTLGAMNELANRFQKIAGSHDSFGHPVELGVELEEEFLVAARRLSTEWNLAQAIPKLATLVTGSPFDAAIHDAFGKVHGLNCYETYDRDFLDRDLSGFLGEAYKGLWLQQYVSREGVSKLPLYHLVGALDPLTASDVTNPVGDGLPEDLPEWIKRDGLTHLKIKLNGDDSQWDLERVVSIDRIAGEAARSLPGDDWRYSLDFNERCQNVDYLIDLLKGLRERSPQGFERVQYIEQPTARDLRANPQNRMHAAAKLKPVVIDESLTDLESLMLARDMGYTGVALKACKGQSQSLLMAAAAQRHGLFLCVQDLTCPGASLIQSASLAAHIPGVSGIEANSRQYCPAANRGWEDRFPGVFRIRNGTMDTSGLRGPGLGAV